MPYETQPCIYLDYQASTPVDTCVSDEMAPFAREFFGNPHSAEHHYGWESMNAVEKASERIAKSIGADSCEIIFTSGATESNNTAILGLARNASKGTRRRLLISAIEHKCVIAAADYLQKELGYKIEYVPVDREGLVVISELEKMIDDDVLLVSIMAVNNEIGTIQNIPEISRLTRYYGAIFHCDAAQAPTAIDVEKISKNVDLLSLSGHKMHGPKGIGVLYVSKAINNQIEPLIYGGGQQNGLRSGTLPTPLCVGMGKAAEFISSDYFKRMRDNVRALRNLFTERLLGLGWDITINGPSFERRHPANINIKFNGFSGNEILMSLQPKIAASSGSACSSGVTAVSHVLRAIGLSHVEAQSSIRFSLGVENTNEEIDLAVEYIDRVLKKLV